MELITPHRLVLHVLPLNSFLNRKRLNLSAVEDLIRNLSPIASGGWNRRFNLDGFLTYSQNSKTGLCLSYCQIFFDGIIETVYSEILRFRDGKSFIAGVAYEKYIVEAVSSYIGTYKKLNLDAPIILSLSLINCKGARLSGDYYLEHSSAGIDRDVVMLPEVQLNEIANDIPTVMKPVFDALWNACGLPRSFNYTESGVWNVRR